MVWHDLNSDGEHDRFVAGSEPDVVMVVDASGSTGQGDSCMFGFVGTAGQEVIERSGSTEWVTVEDGHHFLNPVIIASPVQYDNDNPAADSDPALARIANVAASGSGLSFDLQVDEWEYCDELHTEEVVNYLVIEAGQHMLDDGTIIEAGTFEVDSNGTWVSFSETFGADVGTRAVTPVVLTQVMSYNETDAVTVRVDASFTGFEATLREEGATPGAHATETVGYIAISKPGTDPGTAPVTGETLKANNAWTKFQYGIVDVVNTAQDPDYALDYASGHFGAEAPLMFASMQTMNESDAGTALRFEDATASSVTLRIEEDHAGYHASEEVGFFAIHEGDIWVNVDGGTAEGGDDEIDTIFEAEVVAVKAVKDRLIEQGLGDVADVVVVTYNTAGWYLDMHRNFSGYPETYGTQFHATPNETCYVDLTGPYDAPDGEPDDPDGDGFPDRTGNCIEEALDLFCGGSGGTRYYPGLNCAVDALDPESSLQGLGSLPLEDYHNGNVLFLSDGEPADTLEDQEVDGSVVFGYGSCLDELRGYEDASGTPVEGLADNIRAFGVGHNAVIDAPGPKGDLRDIDPGAERFLTPYSLIQAMIGGMTDAEGNREYVEPPVTHARVPGGVRVYLDLDEDGEFDDASDPDPEPSTFTDAEGFFTFDNLSLNETTTYHVRVVAPNGWEETPATGDSWEYEIELPQNTDEYGVEFGINLSGINIDDESATTNEDTPVAIDVLDGDQYPDAQETLYFARAEPNHGTAAWNGSEMVYTPDPDWHGEDVFEYAVTIGDGVYYTGTVTVTVSAVNDAPRIVTEHRTRDGLELEGTLAVDIENHAMTAVHYFGAEHGTFDMENDGSFTYAPEAGFVGIETIWVNYVDEHGASSGDTEVRIAVCETVFGSAPHYEQAVVHEDLAEGSTVTDSSGDLLVVGSPNSDRAFIYRDSLEGWVLEAELQGDDDSISFGSDVAIRGTTAVVGASQDLDGTETDTSGAIYVFEYSGGTWAEVAKLTPEVDFNNEEDVDNDGTPDHDYSWDYFGSSVAINEDEETIVVGAPGYEFWEYVEYPDYPEYSDKMPYEFAGAAYVFTYNESNPSHWDFDQRLDPNDQEANAEFGNAVDISHDTILVGAHKKDEEINQTACTDAGAAYVYGPGAVVSWEQNQKLTAQDGGADDYFGCSVAVLVIPNPDPAETNDENAVIGARGFDEDGLQYPTDVGAAYYFDLDGTASQTAAATYRLDSSAYESPDEFGTSVDIFGDLVLVGAPGRQVSSQSEAGAAYLIDATQTGDQWRTNGLITAETAFEDDLFGHAVTLGERGPVIAGPYHPYQESSIKEASVHFFAYNRTPAAQDMELVVAGATGTDCECGSLFGVDAFEGDTVTYSIIPAQPDDGYQEHGTFSFEDPKNPEVVTYTPTPGLGYPVSDKFRYKVTDGDGAEDIAEVTVYFGSAQILNRGIFYDGYFDDARDISRKADEDLELGEELPADDNDNIITHPDGITGVIIDVAFPSDPGAFSPADFACLYYDGDSWETVVPTISVEVITNLQEEEGTGTGDDYDCHRVRLTFNPGIKNWLEVTMYDAALGVSLDRFYFGYLEGDATADGIVNSSDLDAVRADWLTTGNPYIVPMPGDLNSDGYASSADLDLVRANWGASVSVPDAPVRGMAMASSSSFSSNSLSSSRSSSRSSTPQWTAEADKVYADYGIGDDDLTNDLAIDEKFWERLYEALGLTW